MFPLLGAEITRIMRRRGSFLGGAGFVLALCVIGILVVFLRDPRGGKDALDVVNGVGSFAGVFAAVIIGALAGSYDTANGTMRYLVLTGVPRWKLTLVRVPGLLISVSAIALFVVILAFISALLIGSDGGAQATTKEALTAVWSTFSGIWIWALVSLAVGTVLRSNGPAIAASIVLFIGGNLITGLIGSEISEGVAKVLLPRAADNVMNLTTTSEFLSDAHVSLPGSFVLLAIWLVALLGLAVWRVQRDEY